VRRAERIIFKIELAHRGCAPERPFLVTFTAASLRWSAATCSKWMSPSSSAKALRDRRGARATLFNEPLQPRRTLGDDVQFVC
jgi:hypothetical protein